MNVLRHNTDYALRMMCCLAKNYGNNGAVSVRILAKEEDVSYQYACKILQKLHESGLVDSQMGSKGGYKLSKEPHLITMLDVIRAMQGTIAVNTCTLENGSCDRQDNCPLNGSLCLLQTQIDKYLIDVSLVDIRKNQNKIAQLKTHFDGAAQ